MENFNFYIQRTNERINDLKIAIKNPLFEHKKWFFEKHLEINQKVLEVLFKNVGE